MGERLSFRHWIALTMKGTWPRGKKLYPAHYALLYYTRGRPRVFNRVRLPIETCRHCGGEIRDYGGHRDKMHPAGVSLTDFWMDTSPNRHAKFKIRPGVNELKPVIPERAILISTDPGDVVFDPFGGGGSTFQAAEKLHRHWIGAELHDSAHIRKRMEENHPLSPGQGSLSTSRSCSSMKISQIRFYGGAREQVCRLGLPHMFPELPEIPISTNGCQLPSVWSLPITYKAQLMVSFSPSFPVTPAEAGGKRESTSIKGPWIPTFAGMTGHLQGLCPGFHRPRSAS